MYIVNPNINRLLAGIEVVPDTNLGYNIMKIEISEINAQFETDKNEKIAITVSTLKPSKCSYVINKDGSEQKGESNFINLKDYLTQVACANGYSPYLDNARYANTYTLDTNTKLIIFTANAKDTTQDVVVKRDGCVILEKTFPITKSHDAIVNEIINMLKIDIEQYNFQCYNRYTPEKP